MEYLIALFKSVTKDYYILFFFAISYIFTASGIKRDKEKIILIYIIIFILSYLNVIDKKIMFTCFFLISFFYFEIFIYDEFKMKIIKSLLCKIIDYVYILIAKYRIISFIILIIPFTDFFNKIIKSQKSFVLFPIMFLFFRFKKIKPFLFTSLILYINYIFDLYFIPTEIVLFIFSGFLFIYLSIEISSEDFETFSFTEIVNKLKYDFNYFKPLGDIKESILSGIEDKSYFERNNDYTLLCFDFLKYKLKVGKNIVHKFLYKPIPLVMLYIKRLLKLFKTFITILINPDRGYSTIEMQLLKLLAVKNGYSKEKTRKYYEFIYSQLFFKGLKKYFKLNYKTVSDTYYKKYIMVKHGEFAPMFIYGTSVKNAKSFWGVPISELTNEEFFLTVLSYSNRLYKEKLSYETFKDIYGHNDFFKLLKPEEFKYAIKKFKKRQKNLNKKSD